MNQLQLNQILRSDYNHIYIVTVLIRGNKRFFERILFWSDEFIEEENLRVEVESIIESICEIEKIGNYGVFGMFPARKSFNIDYVGKISCIDLKIYTENARRNNKSDNSRKLQRL